MRAWANRPGIKSYSVVQWLLVTAIVTGLAQGHSGARNCAGARWERCYRAAEEALDDDEPHAALSLIQDLLDAGHREEDDEYFVTGMADGPYYIYYLKAKVLRRLGRIDEAMEAAKRTEHAAGPELISRLKPPEFVNVQPELLNATFESKDGSLLGERAEIYVSGTVSDNNEKPELAVVGAMEATIRQLESDPESPNLWTFDGKLTVDAFIGTFKIVVTDTTGLATEKSIDVPLPPLDLGPSAGSIRAMLVGVDHYDTSGWWSDDSWGCRPRVSERCRSVLRCDGINELGAARRDAEQFYDFLRWREVPPENIRLLTSPAKRPEATQATGDNMRHALDEILAGAKETDTVIFFFAGHGQYHARAGDAAKGGNILLPSNAANWECSGLVAEDDVLGTTIAVSEIESALMNSSSQQRYMILDACRTTAPQPVDRDGPVERRAPPLPGFRGIRPVSDSVRAPNTPLVLYATQAESVSREWKDEEAGYFTHFLLKGLRQDLNLAELETFVRTGVGDQTAEAQKPVIAWPPEFDSELKKQMYILRSSYPN